MIVAIERGQRPHGLDEVDGMPEHSESWPIQLPNSPKYREWVVVVCTQIRVGCGRGFSTQRRGLPVPRIRDGIECRKQLIGEAMFDVEVLHLRLSCASAPDAEKMRR